MIGFYLDEMISRIVLSELEKQGYKAVMANDVGMRNKDDDSEHLTYAREHNFVLVTMDRPFAGRVSSRTDHTGLICWTGKQNDFGGQIQVLKEFADTYTLEDVKGKVFWLKT